MFNIGVLYNLNYSTIGSRGKQKIKNQKLKEKINK